MTYQYQETIKDGKADKPKSLAELFASDENVKTEYAKIHYGNHLKMDEVVDRPIILLSYSIQKEKSSYTNDEQDFMRLRFKFVDGDDDTEYDCRTQSRKLMDCMKAVGNERLESLGGLHTMICKRKEGAKTFIWFDGIE